MLYFVINMSLTSNTRWHSVAYVPLPHQPFVEIRDKVKLAIPEHEEKVIDFVTDKYCFMRSGKIATDKGVFFGGRGAIHRKFAQMLEDTGIATINCSIIYLPSVDAFAKVYADQAKKIIENCPGTHRFLIDCECCHQTFGTLRHCGSRFAFYISTLSKSMYIRAR